MHESDVIETLSAAFRRSGSQKNGLWESDAEILCEPNGYRAISIDSFSEREDFFGATEPTRIGHNMAVAVISDLLACSIEPRWMVQSWVLDANHNSEYFQTIAEAIESVLKQYRAYSLGGDLGSALNWNWTAAVEGICAQTPVMRKARNKVSFNLYVTGFLGDANAAAFMNRSQPEFECRPPVPPSAIMATDTSGGFFDSVQNFRRVNRDLNLSLELDKIPLAPNLLSIPNVPAELGLIGGVGEYELLFALPQSEACPIEATLIGWGDFNSPESGTRNSPESGTRNSSESGTRNSLPNAENAASEAEVRLLRGGKEVGRLSAPPPDYRAVDENDYLNVTIQYYRKLFS